MIEDWLMRGLDLFFRVQDKLDERAAAKRAAEAAATRRGLEAELLGAEARRSAKGS